MKNWPVESQSLALVGIMSETKWIGDLVRTLGCSLDLVWPQRSPEYCIFLVLFGYLLWLLLAAKVKL
jgi:hypothetical protein